MSFRTVSEELKLATDSQTLLRTFSAVRDATAAAPREEVIALIELPDKPQNGEEIIKTVFATLKELCFLDAARDPFERLETALKEVNAVIGEARETLANKHIGRMNAVIGFISGNELHVTQAGEAEAYLIRHGTITTITEGLTPDDAVDTFVNIASGTLENHDKVVIASERLLRYATKSELTKLFAPTKEIGLALEELDEIIVLEGAQTTGILAIDVATGEVAPTPSNAAPSPFADIASHLERFRLPLPKNGVAGDVAKHVQRHVGRGLSWMREQIPETVQIPGQRKLPIDKNYVVLGFLLVVIAIILTVTWNISNGNSAARLAEAKTQLATVQTQIDIAIRDRNIGNKSGAYDALKKAETTAAALVTTGVAVDEATTKLTQIATLRDELDNIRRFTDIKAVADIGAKKKDVALVGIEDLRGRKVAYDAHSFYEIALDQVGTPVTIDTTSTVRAARYFADRDAMLFLTTDGKIYEWRDGTPVAMKTTDPAWKTGVDIATYSSFLYLLDPTNNQIWKYTRKRDDYGPAVGYSTNTDLTKAVSMAIDGDVWVLAADADGNAKNDIIRIRKGEKRVLNIKDIPDKPWTNPTKIYTNENLKFLYVLDRTGKRVLRFYKDPPDAGIDNKQLVYNTQYYFEGLTDVRDLWVDSAEQKLYVVDGSKLYEVSL